MICNDVDDFVNLVLNERGISECDVWLKKIGCDTGQGSLKLTLNIVSNDSKDQGMLWELKQLPIFS